MTAGLSGTGKPGRNGAAVNALARRGGRVRIRTTMEASACVRSAHDAEQVEAISPGDHETPGSTRASSRGV